MEKIQMKHISICFFIVLISSPSISIAHDTTHIHPLITVEIAKLIELGDSVDKAYEDIYILDPEPISNIDPNIQRLYWGTDFDPVNFSATNLSPTDYYQNEDGISSYKSYTNVIDGVVQEDVPATKVTDHFYHAKNGKGLNGKFISEKNPSSIRAMAFFNESIERMSGYTEEAKQTSFFEFGQALHHVEDMSSPAHIHNDPHITLKILGLSFDAEKDDYEGWYLPQMKQTDSDLSDFFLNGSVQSVSNPWVDIWGTSNNNSMVNYFHDRTTFRGELQFPADTIDQLKLDLNDEIVVTAKAAPPPEATGELKEMFPCKDVLGEPDYTVPDCLLWQEEDLGVLAHWHIKSIGDFQHQYTTDVNPNEWWAIELETDPNAANMVNQTANYLGIFYLEQLSTGNSQSSPLGVPVVPAAMRSNFNAVWIEGINDMSPNTNEKHLLQVYAENLLISAVNFSAGFTQYWYDVANTPPYLISLKAWQQPKESTVEELVYSGTWNDVEAGDSDEAHDVEVCSPGDLLCGAFIFRNFFTVESRSFTVDPVDHTHSNKNLVIELTFNEPIKQISQLLLGKHNTSGVCIESNSACSVITPPPLDENGVPVAGSGVVLSEATDADGDTVWRWEITVDKSKLNNLNGKLQVTVKAIDYNNHRDGQSGTTGGELDGTPNTPAKRNTDYAVATLGTVNPTNHYPWYQEGVANETPNDIAYSYDYADGDQNHVLVFDTSAPSTTINVDLTLQ